MGKKTQQNTTLLFPFLKRLREQTFPSHFLGSLCRSKGRFTSHPNHALFATITPSLSLHQKRAGSPLEEKAAQADPGTGSLLLRARVTAVFRRRKGEAVSAARPWRGDSGVASPRYRSPGPPDPPGAGPGGTSGPDVTASPHPASPQVGGARAAPCPCAANERERPIG